jgi:hypothetical protein
MTDATPHPRRNQAAALVAGALAAVVLATGFVAMAFASGESPKPRPPAVTGSIHLKDRDVFSGRAVRGEVVRPRDGRQARHHDLSIQGARDIMPPLPAGKYTALFFPDGKWHGPHVRPADLVVTAKK